MQRRSELFLEVKMDDEEAVRRAQEIITRKQAERAALGIATKTPPAGPSIGTKKSGEQGEPLTLEAQLARLMDRIKNQIEVRCSSCGGYALLPHRTTPRRFSSVRTARPRPRLAGSGRLGC